MTRAVLGNRTVWLMLLIALVLRLVLAIGVQHHVSQFPGRLCLIPGDAEGYWELAGKIAAREDYSIYDPPRHLLRMPGFPALLALPRRGFGSNSFAARLVLACVGTLACGLTCWLGRELVGETVGLIAGVYTAVSPTMALFSAPSNVRGDARFFAMKTPFAYLSATQGLDEEALVYRGGEHFELNYLVTLYPELKSTETLAERGRQWAASFR